ncbi:MAG: serine/threonine protein kinase, partial [Pirellulaceae bacterium]|nr:serine/threonine protein kinase [Pirellulaceae bacterium]
MAPPGYCPQCGERLPADVPHGICPKCMLGLGFDEPLTRRDSVLVRTGEPGGAFPAPSPAELAEHFPHLEVLELIGQGGMGAVYRARQRSLDRVVALKILHAEVSRDPAFAERFAREAQALARLTHPNIVMVFDFGESHGLYYFLMEYVDGFNLRATLQSGRLSPHEALAIVPQVCEALQYAHDQGIVHRDIKPENVLLDRRGRVKIADFGLAKLLGRPGGRLSLTGTGQVMGTPHYMAPEQWEKPMSVDHRADIYSLGVVFYELLTGELPLGRFAPPSEKADVSADLDHVVLRTLEKEPDRRYQHAREVKTAVEGLGEVRVAPVPYAVAVAPSRLRVPFTIAEVYGGLARADGLLRFDGQTLTLEFQVKDDVVGYVASGVKTVAVPVSEIVAFDWTSGWFSGRTTLELRVDRLETLHHVPRNERGSVRLRIARADFATAQALVDAVQQALRTMAPPTAAAGHAAPPVPDVISARRDRVTQDVRGPATGLMVVGLLNCVTLGLSLLLLPLLLITKVSSTGPDRVPVAVIDADDPSSQERGYSVLHSADSHGARTIEVHQGDASVRQQVMVAREPLRSAEIRQPTMAVGLLVLAFGLLPLMCSVIITAGAARMRRVRNYELAVAAAILAMVPLHPWVILGLPLGIWALLVLHRPDVKALFAERARAGRPDVRPRSAPGNVGLVTMLVVTFCLLCGSAMVAVS